MSAAGSLAKCIAHLVVAGTEDEVRVGVFVHESSDNLSLVDSEGSDLEVLLADKHCPVSLISTKASSTHPQWVALVQDCSPASPELVYTGTPCIISKSLPSACVQLTQSQDPNFGSAM